LLTRFRDLGVSAPVFVMTGGVKDSAKEAEALKAGVAGYLYKPIEVRELDNVIARALGPGSR
jgi:FixJ family two-component response regulator